MSGCPRPFFFKKQECKGKKGKYHIEKKKHMKSLSLGVCTQTGEFVFMYLEEIRIRFTLCPHCILIQYC